MRATDAAVAAHLAARKPVLVRHLLWMVARDRATGAPAPLGLWDGDDHQDIVIDGQTRTYFGAGGLVRMDEIGHAVGTDVRQLRIVLAPLAPEVQQAILGYDPRTAPVEIHRILIDPETQAVIGSSVRRLKGRVSELEIPRPEVDGGDAECRVTIATAAIEGTRGLALKKSDESQKLRLLPGGAPDRFYQYADVSGKVTVKWGEK